MCRVRLVTAVRRGKRCTRRATRGLLLQQEEETQRHRHGDDSRISRFILSSHRFLMSDMDAAADMEIDDKQPNATSQPDQPAGSSRQEETSDVIENPKSPFAPVSVPANPPSEAPVRNSVMATTSNSSGSVSIALHPLVIMNVAEHWTRSKAQEDRLAVVGALIGRQKGRSMEIMNSFELQVDVIDSMTIINRDYYEQKESQFKQVFPELDFLGWYAIGEAPTARDIRMHKQVCEINESPVFLLLNPQNRQSRLPIGMFESVVDLVEGEATLLFSPVSFSLETEEAERIGLDHMARLSATTSNSDVGASVASDHLRVQFNAVKMLRDRVRIIRDYVVDAKRGNVQWNSDILREAHSLSTRLPLVNSNQFKEEFYNQCNEVALMAYLGSLTKGTNTMNQFVNKFITLYERQGSGRRMRGLFF